MSRTKHARPPRAKGSNNLGIARAIVDGIRRCLYDDPVRVIRQNLDAAQREALAPLAGQLAAADNLVQACLVLDNGYRRCVVCHRQTFDGEIVFHADDCAVAILQAVRLNP